MTIKSDKWIRRMAAQGMIEPFEAGQVRDVAGQKIVSYGTSSYGYDVRCAPEFKIFTNINSTIVDPKNFDPRSFVDFEGKVCIIPPNSFALARTVEYFRIPRNVLVACLGKSTYARCFRGDTRVALVDGSAPTLEEMAVRAESGELFWGYSIGQHGRLIVTLLEAPRFIGRDSLMEIELDDGSTIHATPDHEFLLRDARMARACALRPGDSLMPLYRNIQRGYEVVYQPINGHFFATHRLADEWNLRHRMYDDAPGTHRHHVDFDRRNNRPTNIVRLPATEHIRDEFDPEGHSLSTRAAFERLMRNPEWAKRFSDAQSERASRFWSEEQYEDVRRQVIEARRNPTEETRQLHRGVMNRRFPDVIRQERGMGGLRNHKVATIREVPGDHDVYCLTVPEAGNFALESGVFVRNCGIIVNVTPLEPEWEGHVTLEFSNTTPLPAKIYANEGVAQFLFFESDEVCETSYKDRGGKYQGQKGVTLPRT